MITLFLVLPQGISVRNQHSQWKTTKVCDMMNMYVNKWLNLSDKLRTYY